MLFQFHIGIIVQHNVRRALVMRSSRVARWYIYHRGFVTDVIATVAIIPEILATSLPGVTSSGYKAFYLFRLLRLLRVARLLRAVWGASLLANPMSRALFQMVNTATLYLVSILFVLLVFLNLLGCLWWFVAELEGVENSWASQTRGLTHALVWIPGVVALFAIGTVTEDVHSNT